MVLDTSTLNALDWIFLAVLLGFLLMGLKSGLIQAIGGLVGTVGGAWAAGQYYQQGADFLVRFAPLPGWLAKLAAFILIFIIVNRLVGLIAWAISKILHIIPGMGIINGLGGAIFGVIEGMVVLGVAIYFVSRIPIDGWPFQDAVQGYLNGSLLAPMLLSMGSLAIRFLPTDLTSLQSMLSL